MIEVPYLSVAQLRAWAAETLNQSAFKTDFPVQIELIVERDYHMDIVPIVGLQLAFQIDAFISADMQTISVDENVFRSRINRYRFSLAHELAHRILHQEILAGVTFSSADEWKRCIGSIPEKQYRFMEFQANTFANAILIPETALEANFSVVVEKIRENGIEPREYPDICMEAISNELGKIFEVSPEAMGFRLASDEYQTRF